MSAKGYGEIGEVSSSGEFCMKTKQHRGFTLIEILVVIAIIMVLAGLLFAVFGRVRENARKTNCASNMKQLFTAVQLYMQPYDETMPLRFADFSPENNTFEPGNGERGWAQVLQPFIKDTQVFGCPSDGSGVTLDPDTSFTDYAYNAALGYVSPSIGPRTLADIKRPELTILFIETLPGNAGNSRPTNLGQTGLITGGSALTDTKLARHNGGSNIIFCDGHAKWHKAESDTESSLIYAANTPFNQSGESPTFHVTDEVTYP
jgi:prepilin-type N-terminal cleavage/methylation domain-containing protein/prepilin-type processing-associated H-X9-DG protein